MDTKRRGHGIHKCGDKGIVGEVLGAYPGEFVVLLWGESNRRTNEETAEELDRDDGHASFRPTGFEGRGEERPADSYRESRLFADFAQESVFEFLSVLHGTARKLPRTRKIGDASNEQEGAFAEDRRSDTDSGPQVRRHGGSKGPKASWFAIPRSPRSPWSYDPPAGV